MKNIKKISHLEKSIEELKVAAATNKIELTSKYNQLFELYCSNNDLESVKRSLFLQWYSISEPQELTGIPNFNDAIQQSNINRIKHILENEEYDDELITMLKHYSEISGWYLRELAPLLSQINENETIHYFGKRGIMGEYWRSLSNS